MFDSSWSENLNKSKPRLLLPKYDNQIEITHKAFHYWQEHCVECSAPDCYNSCLLYKKRLDNNCSRFVKGIELIKDNNIQLADITFRRWAKLETKWFIKPRIWEINEIKKLSRLINIFEFLVKKISFGKRSYIKFKIFSKIGSSLIRRIYPLLAESKNNKEVHFDGFLLEFFLFDNESIQFNFEIVDNNGNTNFREVFLANPGWNSFFINAKDLPLINTEFGFARFWHDNDRDIRVIFKWIDLIRNASKIETQNNYFLDKQITKNYLIEKNIFIKCVVFDLDNTLWSGIIGDDDYQNIEIKEDLINFIKELDKRGIICSIASKNEFKIAWEKIKQYGLSEYFIYPQINWGPKSKSIQKIANSINIGLDTICFIDDNPFEREQVLKELHSISVYGENEIPYLLKKKKFNPIISEETSNRRLTYLNEIKRKDFKQINNFDIDTFLKNCEIKLNICLASANPQRCFELISRTNQFNISGNKYSQKEFNTLLKNGESYCFNVKDKFGDYGTVGFFRIKHFEDKIFLTDFVMSCRVAEKKIEETIVFWILSNLCKNKFLIINFIKTRRNDPIFRKFKSLGFKIKRIREKKEAYIFKLSKNSKLKNPNIMEIKCNIQ
ncbi:HAD-IIIC family phosphatase [Prochlorococcus sp. AH-716-M06]|nr:HAD-IIIC family phosphatase [Prochlorococcus sp. AH-716-M06]